MMTTGSTRGKCSAEQAAHLRDQPQRMIWVAAPQLAQKRCRECHRERLKAAANKGASCSSSAAKSGNADHASGLASCTAVKQGTPSSIPRNRSALVTGRHASRPSAVSSGKPSRQASSRASDRAARASTAASSARRESARSSPGPPKNGSGGKAIVSGKHGFRGFPIKRRKAGLIKPADGLPPALSDRLVPCFDCQIQREMRENVSHRRK